MGVIEAPLLVLAAMELAGQTGFTSSCQPEQGRLLHTLAGGASAAIGETGTGCGVGLAWLISGRRPGVRVVSLERNPERADEARRLFADEPDVEIYTGDWTEITRHGPFDLLFLDGGGHGKHGVPIDPTQALNPGGTLVIDDLTPMTSWPPHHDGSIDQARLHWLNHPALLTTELRLAPNQATLVGTRKP
ncbi:cytidine deaminase [Kribbella sp. NBC_01245]|uniref:O-methyltransferase n=1 Tax=Kribbella sp. NBC_01245 TaxID=2903578 RepID=UPI002E2AA9CC|nr:cytidine deaminase [Kribbella sp. NBC_01245]